MVIRERKLSLLGLDISSGLFGYGNRHVDRQVGYLEYLVGDDHFMTELWFINFRVMPSPRLSPAIYCNPGREKIYLWGGGH